MCVGHVMAAVLLINLINLIEPYLSSNHDEVTVALLFWKIIFIRLGIHRFPGFCLTFDFFPRKFE